MQKKRKLGAKSESYTAAEARRRFEAALRGGLQTPPKHLKTLAKSRVRSKTRGSK
jgi:hypothetical protein